MLAEVALEAIAGTKVLDSAVRSVIHNLNGAEEGVTQRWSSLSRFQGQTTWVYSVVVALAWYRMNRSKWGNSGLLLLTLIAGRASVDHIWSSSRRVRFRIVVRYWAVSHPCRSNMVIRWAIEFRFSWIRVRSKVLEWASFKQRVLRLRRLLASLPQLSVKELDVLK